MSEKTFDWFELILSGDDQEAGMIVLRADVIIGMRQNNDGTMRLYLGNNTIFIVEKIRQFTAETIDAAITAFGGPDPDMFVSS